jgi:hypothetical protein
MESSVAKTSTPAATVITVFGGIMPEAVIRTGPRRSLVSLPLMLSRASLKRFVAICRHMQLTKVAKASQTQK